MTLLLKFDLPDRTIYIPVLPSRAVSIPTGAFAVSATPINETFFESLSPAARAAVEEIMRADR